MRSFSSNYGNVSSPSPSRSASSSHFSFREPSSFLRDSPPRSSLRDPPSVRSSFNRDPIRSSSVREPLRGRADPGTSRSSLTNETSSLLERYGVRRGSATESPTQALLKQRKQSEPDSGFFRGTARDAAAAGSSSTLFPGSPLAAGPSSSSLAQRKAPPNDVQNISQQDYMNRLMAAHSRVDDLLRSRGLNSDDENKYLRAWEQIPIIREERFRRVRTPSSSSDSGLSTDNDSDRSNSDPAAPTVSDENTDVSEQFIRNEDEMVAAPFVILSEAPPLTETVSLSISAPSEESTSASSHFRRPFATQRVTHIVPLPNFTRVSAHIASEGQRAQVAVTRNIDLKNKATSSLSTCSTLPSKSHQAVRGSFLASASNSVDRSFNLVRRRRVEGSQATEQQRRAVLSSLKRKSEPPIPSTAEISIQHCSFYQVKQNAIATQPEKNVRINFRLTERAPRKCATSVALPAPPKALFCRLDVPLSIRPKPRRTRSTQIPPPKKIVGKLERGMTTDISEINKEARKVNRLKIPEHFLQQAAETLEDITNVRNKLKKVPAANQIIGGFVFEVKPRSQPQSSLKRAGAIRRRPPPQKNVLHQLEPFADFLPIAEATDRPPDPPDTPPGIKHVVTKQTGHLNLPGSLARTATSRGAATRKGSPIAELSETDRRLVEQFRRSLHIPHPHAIIRAISPFNLRCFLTSEEKNRKSPAVHDVKWVRRKSPARSAPHRVRSPSPPCLSRVVRISQQTSKRFFFDWATKLKRVDKAAPQRPKPKRRRLRKWIPRWRKRSEEEIEEVEEEEVEEEVEEEDEDEDKAAATDESRAERVHAKSINGEDVEGLTEGEKAMAAAKRRHDMEEQAKLLDYEEKRRAEREKEEEELRRLKEKQEKRRLEREQEEREMVEKRQQEDEKRRKEEEERKAKIEEEKKKKEEHKNKKSLISGGAFTNLTAGAGGRNFTIPKRSETMGDKFGNIVQAKQEMGMTKDQQEQAKQAFLAQVTKELAGFTGSPADMKIKIKELHQRICKLEADKYDLEKRHERQEYDLKELNERQRQVARNNALKKGLDPAEAGNSRFPPRVRVVSKYETVSEGLTFGDRRNRFLQMDFEEDEPSLAKGAARPSPEWGRRAVHEEIEAYLKNPDRCPRYEEKTEVDTQGGQVIRRKSLNGVKQLVIPKIFAN